MVDSSQPANPEATTVIADVHWQGLCEDRGALEQAVRERGARLQSPGERAAPGAMEWFTVNVDVRTRGLEGDRGYTAHMSISSAGGAYDRREVKAALCEELRSAVAWVLVVLARGSRRLEDSHRESEATTNMASGLPGPGPVSDMANRGDSVIRATHSPRSGVTLVRGQLVVKKQPRFALGAQLIGGWSYLRDRAWGPSVFFEQQPWRERPWAWRVMLLTLANDAPNAGSEIRIEARRTAVALGVSVRVPGLPLALTGGLEAGVLSARGSGALVSHRSRRAWGAATTGFTLELPAIRDRLWLVAGADVSVCPFTYVFRTTSQRTVIESGPLELRAAVGLKSRF